jgi:hypothetical protein
MKNYRASNPKTLALIQEYQATHSIPRGIEKFKTDDFTSETKILAFKNDTLSSLQKKILGYDTAIGGQNCILSAPLKTDYNKYDNGDTITLSHKTTDRYNLITNHEELEIWAVVENGLQSQYEPKAIVGSYRAYTHLKNQLYTRFKDVISRIGTTYNIKDQRTIWKKYKQGSLDSMDIMDLRDAYAKYMSIKMSPYCRHEQFVTTYKAQGKGYTNVAIAFYDMPDRPHTEVAITRAMDVIRIIDHRFSS